MASPKARFSELAGTLDYVIYVYWTHSAFGFNGGQTSTAKLAKTNLDSRRAFLVAAKSLPLTSSF
jgi:hypothetical protein